MFTVISTAVGVCLLSLQLVYQYAHDKGYRKAYHRGFEDGKVRDPEEWYP